MIITQKQQKNKTTFRLIGLRGKLLLVSLLLFILPIAGLNYLSELELFLKNNHSRSVLDVAKTAAFVFRDNASLLRLNQLTQSPQNPILCHTLQSKIIIDGFSDDWLTLQTRQQHFSVSSKGQSQADKRTLSLICANDDDYYYFMVSVNKAAQKRLESFGTVAPATSNSQDIIHFQYLDYYHQVQEYQFNLRSPGWVEGQHNTPVSTPMRTQIRAEWQRNKHGFTFEFKIPARLLNRHIAFKLQQQESVKTDNRLITLITTASDIESPKLFPALNPIVQNDVLNSLRLKQLAPPNTRLWLLNKQQYVNAKTVEQPLTNGAKQPFSILALYRRLNSVITGYPEKQSFYDLEQTRIDSEAIQSTLKGLSTMEWLDKPQTDQMILSVSVPVYDNDNKPIGTLVLEQSNNALLALQDNTFEQILIFSLILFCTIALALLLLSTRLLKRIINLRNDTNAALSNDGNISNQLYRNDNDEIGDLARSFSTLLARIDQNNQYLRSLSGKLSHELRTPLTIIKSSLENMEISVKADDKQKYVQRAQEGCVRLNNLLNRMSEASRLEQSIDSIEKEAVELVSFLNNYMESIQTAHQSIDFIFHSSMSEINIELSPELIAQLIDKLITNAISFHKKGTAIILNLSQQDKDLILELTNYGDLIDNNKLNSIFSSLTSYRTQKANDTHLGIGLYIARLISQFHNAKLEARNNEHEQSVSFILTIPISFHQ